MKQKLQQGDGVTMNHTMETNREPAASESQMPMLGILVLNYNGQKWLSPLFRSIQSNGYLNLRIYLVDNASEDDSVRETLRQHPEVTVLRMSENLGYCMAYNLALPYALADGCEWLIWSNNDVLLEPGCLDNLVRGCRSHSDIGVAGPAFLAWDHEGPNTYMLGNHPQAVPAMSARSVCPIDVKWVEGSFLMVSRSCIEKIGLLDPYLNAFWEEADFCRRARHHGMRVVLVPGALARHFGGVSWSSADLSDLRRRLLIRNQYIYTLANPGQSFARNVWEAIHLLCVYAKESLTSSSPRLLLEHLRHFGKVLSDLGAAHRKWRDDRAGKKPAPTTREHEYARLEILRAGGQTK